MQMCSFSGCTQSKFQNYLVLAILLLASAIALAGCTTKSTIELIPINFSASPIKRNFVLIGDEGKELALKYLPSKQSYSFTLKEDDGGGKSTTGILKFYDLKIKKNILIASLYDETENEYLYAPVKIEGQSMQVYMQSMSDEECEKLAPNCVKDGFSSKVTSIDALKAAMLLHLEKGSDLILKISR